MNLNSFEKGLRKELNKWFSEKGFAIFEKRGFAYFKKQEGYTDYVFIRLGGKMYLHELYTDDEIDGLKRLKDNLQAKYPNLNIKNIAIQTSGGTFDLKPFMKL